MAWQRSTLQYDAQLAYFTRYNSVNFKPDTQGDIVFNGIASNVFRGAFVNGVQGDAAYRLNELHTLRAGFISSGETTNVNSTNGVLGWIPIPGIPPRSVHHYRPGQQGWMDRGVLSAGRVEADRSADPQLRISLRSDVAVRQHQPTQSAREPRLQAVGGEQHPRWLCTLFHAPGAGACGPDQHLGFINTTNQPEVLQNSPVLPERSHVFDVGATQQLGGLLSGLEIGVDGYYKIARDLIDDGQFGAAYVLTAFNYEKGENYGVEWTAKYRNGPFSLYGNLGLGGPARNQHRVEPAAVRRRRTRLYRQQLGLHRPRPDLYLHRAAWPMSGTAPVSAPT